jgi:hypothetical protein
MNRKLRQLIIAAEDKLVWYRSPTGLRYVRVSNAGPDAPPPRRIGQYADAEILGYTTSNGMVSRIIYVLAGSGPDSVPDGCGEWPGYDGYKGEPADPAAFRPKVGVQPPTLARSSDQTIADEIAARAEVLAYYAKAAAQRERTAAAEAERLARALPPLPPPPKPKTWFSAWFGRVE